MTRLQVVDWRRRTQELYAAVRAETDLAQGHALWRAGRDALFRTHPQSPLAAGDPLRTSGLPYWPYDHRLRFELALLPPSDPDRRLALDTGEDGVTSLVPVGRVELPPPLAVSLDVWWLEQYGGGLFLPLRDGTAGTDSYGGGRYLLDTAKGADLGAVGDHLVVDLNFAYHPSCRYDSRWLCPLAPPGNIVRARVQAGERMESPAP